MHQWVLLINEDDLVHFVYIAEKMGLRPVKPYFVCGKAVPNVRFAAIQLSFKRSGASRGGIVNTHRRITPTFTSFFFITYI